MQNLIGKVALVTGGSRGIGAAIALRLAREGADVALTYVSATADARAMVERIEKLGRRGLSLQADSGDAVAVRNAVEHTAAEWGRLDILVNNAGIYLAKPLDECTLEDFENTMNINVRAVFVASQAAAHHMRQGGRIISIGSCLAERVPRPAASLYAMSKTALIGLTKGIARDLGPRGITVNLVHPGPTDTDMNPANGPRADGTRNLLAVPQFAASDDIAGMVAYLASEESRFVTGASLAVDGGFSI